MRAACVVYRWYFHVIDRSDRPEWTLLTCRPIFTLVPVSGWRMQSRFTRCNRISRFRNVIAALNSSLELFRPCCLPIYSSSQRIFSSSLFSMWDCHVLEMLKFASLFLLHPCRWSDLLAVKRLKAKSSSLERYQKPFSSLHCTSTFASSASLHPVCIVVREMSGNEKKSERNQKNRGKRVISWKKHSAGARMSSVIAVGSRGTHGENAARRVIHRELKLPLSFRHEMKWEKKFPLFYFQKLFILLFFLIHASPCFRHIKLYIPFYILHFFSCSGDEKQLSPFYKNMSVTLIRHFLK